MQKYFTSIFTEKIGYALSQCHTEACPSEDEIWNEMISKVRLEKYENNDIYECSKAGIFFWKNI